MILVALMLAAQAAPTPEPSASGEVTVTAARLRRLRLVTRKDRKTGVTSCRFKRRSGDPQLDDAVCTATLSCAATLPERVKRQAAWDQMHACLKPKIDPLLRPGQPWRGRSG